MPTSFPESLDNFVNPAGEDLLSSPDHAQQHSDINDAVEAIQEKVGTTNSNNPQSLEYRITAAEDNVGNIPGPYIPIIDIGRGGGVAPLDMQGWIPFNYFGNLIDGAPDALNTLNELSAALNDNENFASSVVNQIAAIPVVNSATPNARGTVFGTTDSFTGNVSIGDNSLAVATTGSNVGVGQSAGRSITTGLGNVAIGKNALDSATTSYGTIGIGRWAGLSTTGSQNTIVGNESALSLTDGSNNIIIGSFSEPSSNTVNNEITLGNSDVRRFRIPGISFDINSVVGRVAIGNYAGVNSSSSLAIGNYSLYAATPSAIGNTAIGPGALMWVTSGRNNIGIGSNAGSEITTGYNNLAIGNNAQISSPTVANEVVIGNSEITRFRIPGLGIDWTPSTIPSASVSASSSVRGILYGFSDSNNTNLALGYWSMASNPLSGSTNTSIGYTALYSNSSGAANTALGYSPLGLNTSGYGNTAIGRFTMYFNETGSYNHAIGEESLRDNTNGSRNVAVGTQSLCSNTTGDNSTAIGHNALYSATTGGYNTAIGKDALLVATTASSNVAVGTFSLRLSTADGNTAVGHSSLSNNTTGVGNTAVGLNSMYQATTGESNSALGSMSLGYLTTGTSNTAVGTAAAFFTTTGTANTAIGDFAFGNNTTGSNNVAVGYNSLSSFTSGNQNTSIGSLAGATANSGNNNIFIGRQAYGSSSSVSNEITLGNSEINRFRIPGLGIDWNSSNIGDSGWISVSSISNGFSTPTPVAYRKVNGIVYMRGNLFSGTANTTAFTLPEGYRPSVDCVIAVQKYGTADNSYITISTNGNVIPNSTAGWLSSIVFPVG